jgi:hypothetical protein
LAIKATIARARVRRFSLLQIRALIQEEFGEVVAISTVHYYLKQVEEEWRETYLGDAAVVKAAELAKLDHLENEVYSQWERSKQNAETVTTELVGVDEVPAAERRRPGRRDDDGDPREARLEVKTKEVTKSAGQSGDPRYIHNLMEISERRAKLLGLDAPAKQELSGAITLLPPKPLSEMTDDELADYEQQLERAAPPAKNKA